MTPGTEARFDRSAWWVLPIAVLAVMLAACPEEEAVPSAEDVAAESGGDTGAADTEVSTADAMDSDLSDTLADAGPDVAIELPCLPHTECVRGDVYLDDCATQTFLEECADGSACIDGACRDTPLGCHEDAVWRFYDGEPWRLAANCFPRGRCEETPDGSARCNEECEGRMRCEDERAVTTCGGETWVYEDCSERDGGICATVGRIVDPVSYCYSQGEMICVGDDIWVNGQLYRSCEGGTCEDWAGPASCTCPSWRQGAHCLGDSIQHYDCSGYIGEPHWCDGWGCLTQTGGGLDGDSATCCGPSSWYCEGDVLHGCINERIGPVSECEHGCVADPDDPHCCDPESEECE